MASAYGAYGAYSAYSAYSAYAGAAGAPGAAGAARAAGTARAAGPAAPGQAPGHQAPGYQAPGYQAPGYQAPGYHALGYQPGYQAPGYQAPGYKAPGYQPGYQAPGYQAPGYKAPGPAMQPSSFTPTALGRWSCSSKPLPAVDSIRALHVYDFDNTLFKTPLPNPRVWHGHTLGRLTSPTVFIDGGWWHDSRILAATGQGLDKEEPRAWQGWWNESIVDLVRLTIQQPDALCVLLTGRSENAFAPLIKRMVASKALDFDLVSLKPHVSPDHKPFQSTMHFKQLFLNALMETYKAATEIRIYEDRPKHTKGFRDFLADYNRLKIVAPTRPPIAADVVQVQDVSARLDPVVEVAQVQHLINLHNAALLRQPQVPRQAPLCIKKTVLVTSYMLAPDDTSKMLQLAAPLLPDSKETGLRHHGNNILICPRPCPQDILAKVGGIGAKMRWEVYATGCFHDSVWAARVRPVPSSAVYHSDLPEPLVLLAVVKGAARPMDTCKITNWQPLPPDQSFVFETTVGEKVILRIQNDGPKSENRETMFPQRVAKRKYAGDGDEAPRNTHGPHGSWNEPRGHHLGIRGGGRGRGGFSYRGARGSSRGGGRGGRGRGGFYMYRSLDDVEPKNEEGGYGPVVDYDDARQPPSHS